MAKDPAFLFYYQDFFNGTLFMDHDEVGAYIRVLCQLADKGPLAEYDIQKVVGDLWPKIRYKFKETDEGFFYNERLALEVEKRKHFCKTRRDNKLKGLHKRNIRRTKG